MNKYGSCLARLAAVLCFLKSYYCRGTAFPYVSLNMTHSDSAALRKRRNHYGTKLFLRLEGCNVCVIFVCRRGALGSWCRCRLGVKEARSWPRAVCENAGAEQFSSQGNWPARSRPPRPAPVEPPLNNVSVVNPQPSPPRPRQTQSSSPRTGLNSRKGGWLILLAVVLSNV